MQVKMVGQSKNVETEVELKPSGGGRENPGDSRNTEGEEGWETWYPFTANIESGIPCVIPIEALREDNEGYTVWRQSRKRRYWERN